MEEDFGPDWEQQRQVDEERYRMTCDAINRCAEAGANIEDLKTLCRETGVNVKHTVLGDEIRVTERRV